MTTAAGLTDPPQEDPRCGFLNATDESCRLRGKDPHGVGVPRAMARTPPRTAMTTRHLRA